MTTWRSVLTNLVHRKGHKVSKKTLARDKKFNKFIIYSLRKQMGISDRVLSRLFTIHKDTVVRWAEEVEAWPEAEKQAVLSELQTGKNLHDRDVFDNEHDISPLRDTDQKNPDSADAE